MSNLAFYTRAADAAYRREISDLDGLAKIVHRRDTRATLRRVQFGRALVGDTRRSATQRALFGSDGRAAAFPRDSAKMRLCPEGTVGIHVRTP
jgi:hypothetical protein